MRFRKRKEEKATGQAPTPREIGLHGSVADLYQAEKAAVADIAAKKAAFEKHDKKTEGIRLIFCSLDKNARLRKASDDAQDVPYHIHSELQVGAVEAFLEGRHENLQEIVAHPDAFLGKDQTAYSLVTTMLLVLMEKAADPALPARALAKVDNDKHQDILDGALFTLVIGFNDVEEKASALLKAGAKAGHNSSSTLAAAFRKGQPAAIIDMLHDNGADFDEAIATIRAKPLLYGNIADRIELFQYKRETQATIEQLKETIGQLTGKPVAEPDAAPISAPPAPAAKTKTAGTRLRMPPANH